MSPWFLTGVTEMTVTYFQIEEVREKHKSEARDATVERGEKY